MKQLIDILTRGDFKDLTQRYSDIALAGGVVGVVGMMIIPLPTFILDLLLVLNISIAMAMMMIAIYIPSGLALSSYPTIILVTTLFRLALNVSSTRLILLNGDAG